MRHVLIALAALLGVGAAVLAFLLTTNTGLRWTIEQVLARSEARIEIEGVEGRLLGPVSLSGIEYRQPDSGAAVQIERLDLDWRPLALLSGLLHVTRLNASGMDYRQGAADKKKPAADAPVEIPAIPLDIRIDRLGVESLAVHTGPGAPVRIEQASLSGAFDGESVLLRELTVDAQRYSIANGRIRLGVGAPWPLDGRLDWSASLPNLAPFAGSLTVAGDVEGGLSPIVELRQPFTARASGSLSGLPDSLRWTLEADLPDTTQLDRINAQWPALALEGTVEARGDATSARLQPNVALSFLETTATLTGELDATRDRLVLEAGRLVRPDRPDTVELSGRLGLAGNLPFELQGTWRSLRGPETAPWTSPSGEFQVSGDTTALTAGVSGTVAPPDGSAPSAVELNVEARELNDAPMVVGDARLPYFAFAGVTGTELEAEIDFHMRGERQSELRVNAATLAFGERRVSDLEARATGSVGEHEISLAGQLEEGRLTASAEGAYTEGAWLGTLQQLTLDSKLSRLPGRWRLAQPAELAWSAGETRVGELCLARSPAHVCAEAVFAGAENWSFESRADGLPLRWLLADGEQPVEIEGTLAGRASVDNRGAGINGEARLRVDRATVSWQGDEPVTTRFQGLQLDASLDPGTLHLTMDGTVDDGGMIQGEMTTADPLAGDGSIEGTLSVHLPSLRVIEAAAPQLGLAGGEAHVELSVAGRRSAPTVEGRADIRDTAAEFEALEADAEDRAPLRIQRASLQGSYDGESVSLEKLVINAEPYAIESGHIRLGIGAPWPLEGQLAWSAQLPDLAPFTGSLTVSGELDGDLKPRIELHKPFAASARGNLSEVLDSPRWTVDASVPTAVGLGRINTDWPELMVQGTLQAQGDSGHARLQPEVSLTFRQTTAILTGDLNITPDELVVAEARLQKPDASDSVDFSGRMGFAGNLPFELQGAWRSLHGPETAPWASPSGELQVSGDVTSLTATLSGMVVPPDSAEPSPVELNVEASGLDATPVVVGDARLPYVAYAGLAATELSAEVDFRMGDGNPSEVRISAATLAFGERRVSSVEARATGSIAEHGISLAGQFEEGALTAAADGAYSEGRWHGTLHQLSLDSNLPRLPGEWRLAQPAELTWAPGESRAGELCLARAPARICAAARLAGAERWSFEGRASGLPLRWLMTESDQPVEVEGTLAAKASLGNQGDGIRGDGQVTVDQAMVRWQGEEPVTTRYQGLQLDASLDPAMLQLSIDGAMDDGGMIRGELTTTDPLAGDGSIEGTLSAHLSSLRLLRAAAPQLGVERGELQVEVSVAGRRSAPRFEGRADLRDASMEIEALGMRLTELTLSAQSSEARRLELNGRAMAGDGPLEADGFIEWPSGGGWQGEINLRGSEARLVSLPKALIEGSPELHVRMDEAGGTVEGRIRLTRAELTPDAGRPGVTLSDDIVVVGDDGDEPASTNPMDWHAAVTIELGDNTRFNGYGLTGRLTGALDLDAPPHQPTRASGTIDIRDGEYKLYGRSFDIERGRVVYTGGPLDNPGIDLQVDRQVGDVKVSLTVAGPLVEPNLSLTSTPSMSETDRMSYLLLGRPASEASGAEATLLLQAAASLVPGGAQGVPAYIQSTLGLDTLEVRSDTAESEGAAVVLGKYLSPRLYVSYVAGFQSSVDMFRVRYDLARHWLLRAESSAQGSGGDLLFTW